MFVQARGLPGATGPGDHQGQFAGFEGFDEIIQGALPHGFDCPFDRTVGGHHHHARAGGKSLFREQIGAFAVRQIDVQQDEIEILFPQPIFGCCESGGMGDIGVKAFQFSGELLAQQHFIFDDQNA